MSLVGHENVRRHFEATRTRGRLASTYLFVGSTGVGKRTFARSLAASLLCRGAEQTHTLQTCGACDSCQLLAAGGHPDLLLVEKPEGKSTLPIELFIGRAEHRNREGLCHDIAMKPFLAGRRIAIIDDADDFSAESANCLLKTLEEPPPRSLMILIGTSLSKQLPTIRSRSQVVRFAPLTQQQVAEVLTTRQLLEEGQSAQDLAAVSEGSVSQALAAADDVLAAFRAEVEQTLSRDKFDPVRFAGAVMENSSTGGADPATRRRRLRTIIGYAIEHDSRQLRAAAAEGAASDAILHRLDESLTAAEALDRNANQATLVQTWAVSLAGA